MAEANQRVSVSRSDEPETIGELKKYYPEFARQLIQRQNEIIGRQDAARANLNEQVPSGPGDEADVSVLDTSADYFLNLANAHQRELLEIRDAFERMSRGVYGVCEACGEVISIARLKNLPYARLCIDDQSTAERGYATAHPRSKPTL